MIKIKCVVSCVDANGTPTFFPCIVELTLDHYNEGQHYDLAKLMALEENYEQIGIVYDENDGPDFLFEHYFGDSK